MKPSPLKYYNCPNCGPIAVKNLTGDWCPSFECEGQPLPITRAQFIEMTEEKEQFCPRDWVEDFQHENGKYECGCVICHKRFIGHKRRCVCRVCDAESQPKQPTDPTAYPWPEARLAHEFGQPVEAKSRSVGIWFDIDDPPFYEAESEVTRYRQKLNPTMDELKAAYKKNWRGVQYRHNGNVNWDSASAMSFNKHTNCYRLTTISELQKLKEEQVKEAKWGGTCGHQPKPKLKFIRDWTIEEVPVGAVVKIEAKELLITGKGQVTDCIELNSKHVHISYLRYSKYSKDFGASWQDCGIWE